MNRKHRVACLAGEICLLLLTVALLPLNLFVIRFPVWVLILACLLSVGGAVLYVWRFRPSLVTRILLPLVAVGLSCVMGLVACTIPYWNANNFRIWTTQSKGFDQEISYAQAEKDMKEVIRLLARVHPMYKDGITQDMTQRYETGLSHLREMSHITVNDLRREIQLLLQPMHDAHTTTYNQSPNDRYLKAVIKLRSEGYTPVSINGLGREAIREKAKAYDSYESEDWIQVDVGSLASLLFYQFEAPFTYVWENDRGEQITEQYTEADFVSLETYMALQKQEASTQEQEPSMPFVHYVIDEEKSLALLTLTSCINDAYYKNCLREMFTEVKEKQIRYVAVDVRGNGGGNSGVANEFIRYLPVDAYSDAPSDWRWNFLTFHIDAHMKNKPYTELTFTGQVFICTDRHSFSSAMLFPEMIQDNGLGKIIGESPANNANGYGDIAYFSLKESGLMIQISTKKWYRIRTEQPDDYITPDYPCNSEDVLETLYGIIAP